MAFIQWGCRRAPQVPPGGPGAAAHPGAHGAPHETLQELQRRTGESMHEYITRKDELYLRAQQSLLRVLPHYSKKKQDENAWKHRQPGDWGAGTSWPSSRRGSWTSEPESAAQEDVTESEGQEGTEDGSTREGTGTDRQVVRVLGGNGTGPAMVATLMAGIKPGVGLEATTPTTHRGEVTRPARPPHCLRSFRTPFKGGIFFMMLDWIPMNGR